LHAPALAVRANVMFTAHAPVATIARVEERKRDAIAFLQRPPKRIRRNALAETRDHAGELVTGHAAHVRPGVVAVVAPVVEIGSADRGGRVLDQDTAGVHLRGRAGA